MTPPDDPKPGDAPVPTFAHISRYPTEQDLAEALGPPRPRESQESPTTFPRFIHEFVDEPPTGFPRKTVALVASAQGTLKLAASLETATGDRLQQSLPLYRSDAFDLIAALADWVASPDSILREYPDGRQILDVGPKNAAEARVFAEESFRVDVQVALHGFMVERGVSQPELAERMGVSEVDVAAFFEDEANITIRDLARFYHALGLPPPSLHPYPRPRRGAEAPLAQAAAAALRSVRGVDAAFLGETTTSTIIYAVGREHETVDACGLREAEARLANAYDQVEIHVRAHQGRDVDSLGLGKRLI